MTNLQEKVIRELRAEGYCVVVWTPEELGNADESILEDLVTERGNNYISTVKWMK